jgi:hypothetical protein
VDEPADADGPADVDEPADADGPGDADEPADVDGGAGSEAGEDAAFGARALAPRAVAGVLCVGAGEGMAVEDPCDPQMSRAATSATAAVAAAPTAERRCATSDREPRRWRPEGCDFEAGTWLAEIRREDPAES